MDERKEKSKGQESENESEEMKRCDSRSGSSDASRANWKPTGSQLLDDRFEGIHVLGAEYPAYRSGFRG